MAIFKKKDKKEKEILLDRRLLSYIQPKGGITYRDEKFISTGDGFWIFFRLGKVDRDIQSTIFCINSPFAVLFDTVSADIITVLTQLVVESSCFFRRLFVFFPESVLNLSRTWQ